MQSSGKKMACTVVTMTAILNRKTNAVLKRVFNNQSAPRESGKEQEENRREREMEKLEIGMRMVKTELKLEVETEGRMEVKTEERMVASRTIVVVSIVRTAQVEEDEIFRKFETN